MKKIIFFLMLICAVLTLKSQDDLKHCGADELRIATLKQNREIADAVIRRDIELEKFTKQFVEKFYNKQTSTATYTIPVVFHVIHNYGPENISDAQILDGLDIVNKTFRKQLADTGSIVTEFKPLHADCDIEFRLATLDPEGNCTSGINRIASPLTTIGDHSVKTLVQWPPNKYLNIYIVSQAANLAGHCVWPSDADTIPEWDGIVIGHNYVGTIGTSSYLTSVAFAHECGHYLNLQHIWGGNNVPGFYYYPCADPNKDCAIDDSVADTPPTIGWQSCNLAGASCGNTVDNVQNVMDYSYCNRMFTYGQKARMQACLNSSIAGRNNLWQPSNLAATGVSANPAPLCIAGFTSNKRVICKNSPYNTIDFTNTSHHGPFTSILWSFPGGAPATSTSENETVSYATPGKYDVTLKVIKGSDSITITKANYIYVLPSNPFPYPFSESFEATTPFDSIDWFSNSFDTINEWSVTSTAAYSGTRCIMLNNFNNTMGTKDELYSRTINLAGASSLNLSFKYAYAKKDSSNNDRLQLFFSSSCNNSWYQRLNITNSNLETVPPTTAPFVPASNADWKQVTASIPSTYFNSSFKFRFVFTSNGGNNIYIDDINLDMDASINNLEDISNSIQLFPNPASDQVNIAFNLNSTREMNISIINLLGQTIYTAGKQTFYSGENTITLDVKGLSPGSYFVAVSHDNNSIKKSLIIIPQ
ncbi:MAG: M43 family zinc metalloprotease [Bacteroidia bacterium]